MVDAWRRFYPFESRWYSLPDGHRMHYVDCGKGSPILMVHGNPTWSYYFRNMISGLSDESRVVAPDHVGCGLSDKPQDPAYYTLTRHIDNLENLVTMLDLRDVTLMVHDWGGAIGCGLARRQPDRIRRLIISNTAAFNVHGMPWLLHVCRIPGVGSSLIRGLNAFAGALPWLAVQRRLPPDERSGYLAPYDNWENRIATLRFVQDIPQGPHDPAWVELAEIEAFLPSLADRPALLLWGARDWVFTPAFLARWQQFLPQAEVRSFPEANHLLFDDAGEACLSDVRRFLQQVKA